TYPLRSALSLCEQLSLFSVPICSFLLSKSYLRLLLIRDFHPLETCAARRTSGKGGVASFATPFLLLHERFTMVILHKDEEIFKKIEKRY
ncbi:MAG: hypothetical protein ACLU6W_03915, partial [Lachnospiraceae bacterium]